MSYPIATTCRIAAGMRSSFSILALTVVMAAGAPALAGTYHVTDDASLRAAIASANADADASATIILDNDITIATPALPGNTKPITIDTGSHTFTSGYRN